MRQPTAKHYYTAINHINARLRQYSIRVSTKKRAMIVQIEMAAIQSTSCSHKTYFGGQNVIPLFGKAAIPKDWSKTKDSSPQRLIVLPLAMDITEFYPSTEWATIDRTRQEWLQDSAFQISGQYEFVCSSYDRFNLEGTHWFRTHHDGCLRTHHHAPFETITSNPSSSKPSPSKPSGCLDLEPIRK